MIELIFQKELMLMKQMHQKNVVFVVIGILKIESYLCNGFHDLMQKGMSFNDVAFFMLKEVLTEFTFDIWVRMMQLA